MTVNRPKKTVQILIPNYIIFLTQWHSSIEYHRQVDLLSRQVLEDADDISVTAQLLLAISYADLLNNMQKEGLIKLAPEEELPIVWVKLDHD